MPPKTAKVVKATKTVKIVDTKEKEKEQDDGDPTVSDRKITQMSQRDHIRSRSMWSSGRKPLQMDIYVMDDAVNKFVLQSVELIPANLNLINEILANCIDHWYSYPKYVKNIWIEFKDGHVAIRNDGPAIEIKQVTNIDGKQMWLIEQLVTQFYTGSNLGVKKTPSLGINGLGLSLVCCNSTLFRSYVNDGKRQYTQNILDGMNTIEPPVIKPSTDKNPFVEFGFTLDFELFEYKKSDLPALFLSLEKAIIFKAYQAKVFTGINIWYNKKPIEIPSQGVDVNLFRDFISMFCADSSSIYNTVLSPTKPKSKSKQKDDTDVWPWDVCITCSDGRFKQLSLVNGLLIENGGSFVKHLQNQLVDDMLPRVKKVMADNKIKTSDKDDKKNSNTILNCLFIGFKGSIVAPEFSSQAKNYIDDPIGKFKAYVFTHQDLDAIWCLLEETITQAFMGKLKERKKTRVERGTITATAYIEARLAGDRKRAHETTLFICEGSSAQGTVHTGITHESTGLSYEFCGCFDSRGVPLNSRKECRIIPSESKDEVRTIVCGPRFLANERLTSLARVLGLDRAKTYETKEELKTLRYGRVIFAVDQDLDGVGNIAGLLLAFFGLWPALIQNGYVLRLNTPIIRCFPLGAKANKRLFVDEFYNLTEFKAWQRPEGIKYKIRYYKGLGGHDKDEIKSIFKNLDRNLVTYRYDDLAGSTLDIFLGNDPDLRKHELAIPVEAEAKPTEEDGKFMLTVSEHLKTDTKAYQRDNILRKLPNAIDGLTPSRRKLLYTAMLVDVNVKKVSAFVNEASRLTGYHHGEQSLSSTCIRMALRFPGARSLPIFINKGTFSTRSDGGHTLIAARYAFISLNKPLVEAMYPQEDLYLLEYTSDEGELCEPVNFAPVLPMSILESYSVPATGWKVDVIGRHIDEVIANVRRLMDGKAIKKMAPWKLNNRSELVKVKNDLYSVGKYTYDARENKITITELPLGKFPSDYIGEIDSKGKATGWITKPELLCPPEDNTNDKKLQIILYLKPDMMDGIRDKYPADDNFDHVIKWLKLRVKLISNLNMVDGHGVVREYKKYEEVLRDWFRVRADLYARRIDRQMLLLRYNILFLENIIRFTAERGDYDITFKTTEAEWVQLLTENKYDRFNAALLRQPKHATVAELKAQIVNGEGSNYNYLIDLTQRQTLKEACDVRQSQLDKLREQLTALADDCEPGRIGYKTWAAELTNLEKVIHKGLATDWEYDAEKPRFRD